MNLNFLIEKNHIFKRRYKKNFIFEDIKKIHTGIFSKNKIRFELVYLKTIKKIFRKRYYKKNPIFSTPKFWLMIKPNFLLTMKSKNSRMGSGVGLYVRVCSLVHPNKPIILLRHYSIYYLQNAVKYLKKKLNINTYFHKTIIN